MSRRTIVIATDNNKSVEFLTAYFADTQSIPTVIRSKADLAVLSSCQPDLIFFQGDWVDQRNIGRLVQIKSAFPKVKCFSLGQVNQDGFSWDGGIELPVDEKPFR